MGDLDEVVDLGTRLDAGLADGRAIDRRVGSKLHIVFDDHDGHLRNLLVVPSPRRTKP